MRERSVLFTPMKRTLIAGTGACVLLVVGCDQTGARAEKESESKVAATSKDSSASADKPDRGSVAPAAAQGAAAPPEGRHEYTEEAFLAKIVAPKEVSAGKTAVFQVVLEATNGYKVNPEYPLKFAVFESPGAKASKATVRKEDAKVEGNRVDLPVTVTISTPGTHQVGGKLSFSVCTDERCLIEKRDLLITVTAS